MREPNDRDILVRLADLEGITILWSCTHECFQMGGHQYDCHPIVPGIVQDAIDEITFLRQQLEVRGMPIV